MFTFSNTCPALLLWFIGEFCNLVLLQSPSTCFAFMNPGFLDEQQKSFICVPLVLFSTNTLPVTVCGTDCDILRFAHTFPSASVSSSALMPQRSEWRSSGRTADSCSSVSRMLRRPSSLLCLLLLAQVLPARCRPTSADEGTLPFLPPFSGRSSINIQSAFEVTASVLSRLGS